MDRRLAAILAADVAGFSALVGLDEEGTLRSLKGHLDAIEPIIGLNGGRIFKHTGDGFLAEFQSVVGAVACAAAVQRRIAERNVTEPRDRLITYRIGVHVGDVVIEGEDLLGDGVNIAARLEGQADPGGVLISNRVYEDVIDKLDLTFEDMGELTLKNIARPVRAHALRTESEARSGAVAAHPKRPVKPSVAVLAFENLSSDPEQDYFADGITEDIITALSRAPWLFVIARNSSFSYKGLSVDVRQIGRELGVRYVLEGSVRKVGANLRVTGQLVDAETGAHLWANKFDGKLEDVFALQDRITDAVVAATAPQIRMAEIDRAARKRPENLDAYDHVLRAQAAINRFHFREADRWFEDAIALAPDYAIAKAMRAWVRTVLWHPDCALYVHEVGTALALAEDVLAAPDADIEAKAYAGYTVAFLGDDFERGLGHVQHAVDVFPNCVSAWCSSCVLNAMRGNVDTAIAHGEQALRLSPRDPMSYRAHLGLMHAHFVRGDYNAHLAHVEQARDFYHAVLNFMRYEIAALAHLGRLDEAKNLATRYLAIEPGASVSRMREIRRKIKAMTPELYEPLYEGLLAAGVPE